MTPKPGAYRQLFHDALNCYAMHGACSPDTTALINHYRALLENPAYIFCKPEYHSGHKNYAPGELFMRS